MKNRHLIMGGIGAAYTISLYALGTFGDEVVSDRALMIAFMLIGVFGAALLMFLLPLGWRKALLISGGLAVINAVLLLGASFRFDEISGDLFSHTGRVWIATVLIPMPFLLAWAAGRRPFSDYAYLYEAAWALFMRYALGAAFGGLFYGVVYLFAQAFDLIGIGFFKDLLQEEILTWGVLGAAFGVATVIIYENDVIIRSVLRLVELLFRVLLPVVTGFSTLFLIALFVQTIATGEFDAAIRFAVGDSVAGFYGAMLAAGVVFLTASVSRSAAEQSDHVIMTWSGRIMSVNVILLAALVVWALVLRVGQYGWTPNRLTLAAFVALGAVYGIGYIASQRQADWQAGVRRTNLSVALIAMALGFLWLTPGFNANAISAKSQATRIVAGAANPEQILFDMDRDFGLAGQAMLERLRGDAANIDGLEVAFQKFDDGWTPYDRDIGSLELTQKEWLAKHVVGPEGGHPHLDLVLTGEGPLADLVYGICTDGAHSTAKCDLHIGDLDIDLPGDEIAVIASPFALGSGEIRVVVIERVSTAVPRMVFDASYRAIDLEARERLSGLLPGSSMQSKSLQIDGYQIGGVFFGKTDGAIAFITD